MKKSLFFLYAVLFFATSGFSQRILNNIDGRCGRQNMALKQSAPGKQNSLMDNYDVKFYFLNIALERTSEYISGSATINAVVQGAALDTFYVEFNGNLIVDTAFINGVQVPVYRTGDELFVLLSSPVSVGGMVSARIVYHGDPLVGGGFFSGISNGFSPTWGNQATWTLSEPYNAYQWWPCKQSLTDKADSAWVFITTNSTNKAGSEGLLTAITPVAGGKSRYEWKTKHPIDYYLISAAVAQYVDYTIYAHPAGTTDSIMIQSYVYNNPATLPYFQDDIDTTAQFIELYSELFGMYPYIDEKYGHCMAPMGGGMEHQTMTTLGNFNFYLICHELTHQWWGDYMTCATWSDIWLNEGFASYGEYLAAQYIRGFGEAQSHMLDVHDNVMSQPGGSVYVPPAQTNDINRIFDGRLSYDKGSAIIHMIRFELQDDSLFFQLMKDFLATYGDTVATGVDFKNMAESNSGLDFDDFFNQWYFGEGFPSYNIYWAQWDDTIRMTSTQTSSSGVTPLFKMLMEYKLVYAGGDTSVFLYQTANVNDFRIHTSRTITNVIVDPLNWVVDGPPSVIMGTPEKMNNSVFFTVGPNPCRDQVTIGFPNSDAYKTVSVYDVEGQLVLWYRMDGRSGQINMASLPDGVYVIMVADETSIFSGKIVKIR